MRKKDTTDGGAGWSSGAPERVTPLDVQQKEFHVTRVGAGYRMREVDEFLDQVTDTLSALIAENERLVQRTTGSEGSPSARPGPPTTPADGTDRAAVEAFLLREKGFLQDLGGLVQAHAEELRSMVRDVRRPVPEPMIAAEPEAAEAAADGGPDEAAVEADATSAAPGDGGEAMGPTPHAVLGSDQPAPDDEDERAPTTIPPAAADEPIRVEEPEPARSRRSDDEEGDSLRELFWGEE